MITDLDVAIHCDAINKGSRLLRVRERGVRPFSKLTLTHKRVFELTNHNYLDVIGEKEGFLNDTNEIPYRFDIWMIPSVLNVKRLFHDMKKQSENILNQEILQQLQDSIGKDMISMNRKFLIIDFKNSESIMQKFKDKGYSLMEIPEAVAKVITVKYVEERVS